MMALVVSYRVVANTGALEVWALGLAARIEAIVAKYANLIADTARALAPVSSGALRASIRVILAGMAATIIAGEGLPHGYAGLQEFGFLHKGGIFVINPFMRPALARHQAAFEAEIRLACTPP